MCANPALMTATDTRLSTVSRWQCASGCMGTNDKQHLPNICSVLTSDAAFVSRLEFTVPCIFSYSFKCMFHDVNSLNVPLMNSHTLYLITLKMS